MGALSGRHIMELTPLFVAARATPWAWLPAEQAMTPRFFSSSESIDILYPEPRSLKEPVFCKFSGFKNSWQSSVMPSVGTMAVSRTIFFSTTEAWKTLSILSILYFPILKKSRQICTYKITAPAQISLKGCSQLAGKFQILYVHTLTIPPIGSFVK
jgi:hypothetical protein